MEGFGGYPLPANIPIEQFESLETLKLVGEAGRLLDVLQPHHNVASGVLLVPFLSRLELHPALHEPDLPFEILTKILRKRKEAGHGVKTLRIVGGYGGCPSEVASELTKSVDVLMVDQLPDSVENNTAVPPFHIRCRRNKSVFSSTFAPRHDIFVTSSI